MAHGYAGVKEHGITRFAEAFANAGFVVLVHDHRTFGISPRRRRLIAGGVGSRDRRALLFPPRRTVAVDLQYPELFVAHTKVFLDRGRRTPPGPRTDGGGRRRSEGNHPAVDDWQAGGDTTCFDLLAIIPDEAGSLS
jgi:hypothetical protein